jgi:rhamnogalacturonyl hydrolase YesR
MIPFKPLPACLMRTFIAIVALLPSQLHAADEPKTTDILRDMKRVADWQLANPSRHPIHDWTQAPFFMGLAAFHQVSGETKYLTALDEFGKNLAYGPGPQLTHADDHAVLQAWLELYELDRDKAKLQPSINHFVKIADALSERKPKSISGGTFTWCWCDALFMSPPVWARLSKITGDPKYLELADREWWTTTDLLYNPQYHLYYRDNHYFNRQTPSGKKVFWSRGNGWVLGGLVNMLDHIPADHPSRVKYLGLYHDMMHEIVKLQNPDGLWRTSLLDSDGPVGESSGTAFYVQAMAWGLSRGLLPEGIFRPAVMKGYKALAANIQPDGMLGFVQKIGDAPDNYTTTAKSTEVYGSGAFLTAGAEIIRLLDVSKRRNDVVSFEGVKLPERFMPAEPRTHARFVPERADDFAWENDLIAFRAYGPALRGSAEDSGFDAWFKRVPYPIIEKWYMEDRLKLPYANVNKSYHEDHGEGLDSYKVGNSRGCGGISVWDDGKLHNSNTFVAHRMIQNTPEKTVFELDYTSGFKGGVLRETKRITVVMGQRLFQCDSRFTLDGKPVALEVAIGLMPQSESTASVMDSKAGIMQLWDTPDGIGLGTGIVISPSSVLRMIKHDEPSGPTQALCLAKTDSSGHIRWFAGYGWQGQGEITSQEKWTAYLKKFASQFLASPFADYSGDTTFKTHTAALPQ